MVDLIVNFGIPFSYLLLGIAVLGAIAAPVIELAQKPEQLKGAGIGVAVMVVVFGIGYVLGDSNNPSKLVVSEGTARMIDTGLYAFYIMALVAVIATVYAEVSKLIK